MTNEELRGIVEQKEALGHSYVMLIVKRKTPPKSRCRVLPGVIGQCVGYENGDAFVSAPIASLRAYLNRSAATLPEGDRHE